MIQIDKILIEMLFAKAESSERNRMHYDLRNSQDDGSQRMLNALLPDTIVNIHRHPMSNESVILIKGKLDVILFDEKGQEKERYCLDYHNCNYGCVIPQGTWHSVEVIEPSIIYETKDGKYGADGSETI